MKKHILRFVLPLIGITLLNTGQAQARQPHYSHQHGAVHAAHRFEKAAKHMHHHLHHTLGRDYLTKSARKLFRAAKRYRRALEYHQPSRYQRRQFEELAARFHDFRGEYYDANLPQSRRTRQGIRRLKRSFQDLRYEARHSRYSYRRHSRFRDDYRRRQSSDVAVLDDAP